jgi:hypothetical protein
VVAKAQTYPRVATTDAGWYVAPMTSTFRLPALAALAATGALGLATAAAPATSMTPAPPKITAKGVGQIKLGARYKTLRAAHLLGPIGPGCELAGPQARSARLVAPLKGSVDFTMTNIRRVATITVGGGAKARGVGIGATRANVKQQFPKVVFDHSIETTAGVTIARIPKSGGGRLEFAIDTTSKKVTLIGIPRIPICD